MLDKINPIDYKFVPLDPEPNFSPEHNRKVIQQTIEEGEKLWKKRQRLFNDGLKERTQAIGHYVDYQKMGGESSVVDFFGKKELYMLKGQAILEELKKQHYLNPESNLGKEVKKSYAEIKTKR